MAWNEPGNPKDKNDEKDKDPWTGKKREEQGPPELDELFRKMLEKFNTLLGNGKNKGNGKDSKYRNNHFGLGLIILAIIAFWAMLGIFIVQPAELSVILRFGQYSETVGPGVHWIPLFIESQDSVDIQKIYTYTYPVDEDVLMLTKDENLVGVSVNIWYRIADPKAFLYNVVNPLGSLNQATASALRQVIGLNNLDDILTTGREQVRAQVKQQLTSILSRYNLGIEVTDVALKTAKAPEEVKASFDDAIKAREDEQRYINQAQAYAMQVEPIAEGQAQRLLESGKAYQQQVVLQAQGNTASFLALLPQYKANPQVLRERLYFDSLENVFKNNNKIFVDVPNGNNVFYLPLDKMMNSSLKPITVPDLTSTTSTSESSKIPAMPSADSNIRPTRVVDQTDNGYGSDSKGDTNQ